MYGRGTAWLLGLLGLVGAALVLAGCEVRVGDATPVAGAPGPGNTPVATLVAPPGATAPATGGATPGATAPGATAGGTAPARTATALPATAGPATQPLDAARVYDLVRPAVVNVTTSLVTPGQLLNPREIPAGSGTGVIFDSRGYILTNSHVIQNPIGGGVARPIRVTLADERTLEAEVVDDDPGNDLAILKIEAPDLRPARLGDSARLRIGSPVAAIGYALALPGGPSLSTGVVSAINRSIEEPNGITLPNLIQTDAAINPGNSGGPLLNAEGEVIGINTAGAARAQGINFAVAINQARPALDSVVASGRVVRPYLGLRVVGEVTPLIAQVSNLPAPRGVVVEPVPGGPAARGGVQSNDIVVAADGQDVRTGAELQAAIFRHQPGEQMRLRVARQGSTTPVDVTATLVEAPR
ncbi:MAG TPA: trypsin-like peptidase domain-containing protein [Chloroflexota bacterium]|nr:trypsin-like peptidase domain-containing protein [Chloroflexota bacterium]